MFFFGSDSGLHSGRSGGTAMVGQRDLTASAWSRGRWAGLLATLVLALLLTAGPATAQQEPLAPPEAAFLAYHCEFIPEINSARIHAVLTNANGQPMPTREYTVGITASDTGDELPAANVTSRLVGERDPLRLILVLDVTDSVPLPEIISGIETELLPNLQPEDQVALLSFSDTISPITQFFTDKQRLIDQHLRLLRTGEGQNRLYDTILEAVQTFTPESDMRQAVLVVTDSGRREQPQAETADIIELAQASKVQIYTIGYFYEDSPDANDLRAMADETEGYNWLFNGTRSRDIVGVAVADYLGEFVETLNTEITIDVSMRSLLPGPNAQSAGVRGGQVTIDMGQLVDGAGNVPFTIAVDSANDATLSDEIICPIRILNHSITFVNARDGGVFTEPVEIEVSAQSDMSMDGMTIAFWVNDAIVQNSRETTYTFDAPNLQPGPYSIRAQLRDRDDNVLATTRTIQLNAKQRIELRTVNGEVTDLEGITRFEAVTNPNLTLPEIEFRVGSSDNPGITYPFGAGRAPVRENGRAILTINNIRSELERIFPQGWTEPLRVSAFISGAAPDRPLLAESNVLEIFLLPLPPPPIQTTQVLYVIPWLLSLFLLLANISLIRAVGSARIRKMINRPDGHNLNDRLMTITVRRDGMRKSHLLTKKTMYVGRGSTNDINLGDDPTISRQHGVVMWRNQQWYYANRKRGIKTRINGKKYVGYALYKLEPVTEMEIGNAHLIFHSNAQQDISELTKTNL